MASFMASYADTVVKSFRRTFRAVQGVSVHMVSALSVLLGMRVVKQPDRAGFMR
jgi:hypothetical protein